MDFAKLLQRGNNISQLMKIADTTRAIEENPIDVWRDDYDIKHFDQIVCKYLNSKLPKVKDLEREKESLNQILKNRPPRLERLRIEEKIHKLDDEIEKIKTSPGKYSAIADEFLKLYKTADKEYKYLKSAVISDYLTMVREFYPHRIQRDFGPTDDDKCPYDDTCLINYYGNEDDDDEKSICPTCNKIFNFSTKRKFVTVSKKKEYDPNTNFKKILAHVEGKVSIEFPAKLWTDLDEKLEESGKKKEELGRQDIAQFLYASNNLAQFSLHLTAICKIYCNIQPPDFADIRDKLCDDYSKFYEACSTVEKDIESSLNSLYAIWKLLKRNRYNGNIDDFKPLLSPTTLAKYESYYSEAIAKLGWDE